MDSKRVSTEGRNPASEGLDTRTAHEIVELMHEGDTRALEAVSIALTEIVRAAEDAASTIESGGVVCYAGAGTSGRLAVLDATEVRPTYGSTSFKAVIAGGARAMAESVEGAEDDSEAGEGEASVLGPGDMAVGISASGSTPFVLGYIRMARERGARTWLLTCSDEPPEVVTDGIIRLVTGPELIAGSTRLKAGTATKMALNMISTTAMVLLGGTYNGLMVDLIPNNSKLRDRAERIIMEITGRSREEAANALSDSGMRPKTAALMLLKGINAEEAESLLLEGRGSLRRAIGS